MIISFKFLSFKISLNTKSAKSHCYMFQKLQPWNQLLADFSFLLAWNQFQIRIWKELFFFSFKRIKASVGKYFVWTRWLETNRWPDISSTKMGLFGINRELQFRVCSHGEPCTSPHTAREGEHFYKGKKEVGRALFTMALWQSLSPGTLFREEK